MSEYCHNFWKICLPAQAVQAKKPPTQRPSWYCRTSKDCQITEQCHKRFHACYTRPAMSTVRRDVGNSRKCVKTSDCGRDFYCHDRFQICLKNVTVTTVAKSKTKTAKPCGLNAPCPNGMLCHNFWNICYTPPQVVSIPPKNKTHQCQIDSDCRPGEFCYTMAIGQVFTRLRRNIQNVCLSRKPSTNKKDAACKTDSDCGPNKCCLGNLGVCMAYKLPGEMCLMAKVCFVEDIENISLEIYFFICKPLCCRFDEHLLLHLLTVAVIAVVDSSLLLMLLLMLLHLLLLLLTCCRRCYYCLLLCCCC